MGQLDDVIDSYRADAGGGTAAPAAPATLDDLIDSHRQAAMGQPEPTPFAGAEPPQGFADFGSPPPIGTVGTTPGAAAIATGQPTGEPLDPSDPYAASRAAEAPLSSSARRAAEQAYEDLDRAAPTLQTDRRAELFHQMLIGRQIDPLLLFDQHQRLDPRTASRQYFTFLEQDRHADRSQPPPPANPADASALQPSYEDAAQAAGWNAPAARDRMTPAQYAQSVQDQRDQYDNAQEPGVAGAFKATLGDLRAAELGFERTVANARQAAGERLLRPLADQSANPAIAADAAARLGRSQREREANTQAEQLAAPPADAASPWIRGLAGTTLKLGATAASGGALGPQLFGQDAADQQYAHAMAVLQPRVRAGEMSIDQARGIAQDQAEVASAVAGAAALLPGLGGRGPTLAHQLVTKFLAGAGQGELEEAARQYQNAAGLGEAIDPAAAVRAALIGGGANALVHGIELLAGPAGVNDRHVAARLGVPPELVAKARATMIDPVRAGAASPAEGVRAFSEAVTPAELPYVARLVKQYGSQPRRLSGEQWLPWQPEQSDALQQSGTPGVYDRQPVEVRAPAPPAAPAPQATPAGVESAPADRGPGPDQPGPVAGPAAGDGPPAQPAVPAAPQAPPVDPELYRRGAQIAKLAGRVSPEGLQRMLGLQPEQARALADQLVADGVAPMAEQPAGPQTVAAADEQLYERAKQIAKDSGRASVSLLQRHLTIGFGRAQALVQRMVDEGLVDRPPDGGVPLWKGAQPPAAPVTPGIVGEFGGGMAEAIYDRMWQDVTAGRVDAKTSPLAEQVAARAYRDGLIADRDQMQQFVREAMAVAGAQPAGQKAAAVQQWYAGKLSSKGAPDERTQAPAAPTPAGLGQEVQQPVGDAGPALGREEPPGAGGLDRPPEVRQQEDGGAGQQGPPPEVAPPPPATPPAPRKPPKPFSRADLQQRIRDVYRQEGGGAPPEAWQLAEQLNAPFVFPRDTKYAGEIRQVFGGKENGGEGVAIARSGAVRFTADPAAAGGEDAIVAFKDRFGNAGEDLYWQLVRERAGLGFRDALAHARGHQDPQTRFLAAMYDHLPPAGERPGQRLVDPQSLAPGTTFELDGHHFEVQEDEDGLRVLRDGDEFPVTPVESLPPKIPVDKGTMRANEPALPEGDFAPPEQPPDRTKARENITDPIPGEAQPAAPTFFNADEAGLSRQKPGLFGQPTFDAATGREQGGMFETTGQPPASAPIAGSKAALDPRNTPQMFPPAETHAMATGAAGGKAAPFRRPAPPAAPQPGPAPTPAHLKGALYGPGSIVGDVAAGRARKIAGGLAEFVDQIRQAVAPQTRSEDAGRVARALREMMARRALRDNRTLAALGKASALFDGMGRAASIEFWDRAERGLPQGDAKLDAIARALVAAEHALGQEVQRVAPGKLRQLITDKNYLGRIWKNPAEATDTLSRILGKRPLEGPKGFLKKRSLAWFADGIKAGLEPVSYNPVDVALLKMAEMRRFIEMRRTLNELKATGLRKYVGVNDEAPEGWETIDDPAFKVYGPPTVTVEEAFDKGVRQQLLELAGALGVKHERKVSLGKAGVQGLSYVGQKRIETKFGGPDSVIAHELGHQIDERWDLQKVLVQPPPQLRKLSDRQKYVRTGQDELKALAALRLEFTPDPGPGAEGYVQKWEEQSAAVVQAWVSARDKFRKAAPNVYRRWVDFLNRTPQLHPLLEVEPSMDIAGGEAEKPHGGLLLMGRYYVPAEAAQLFRNVLTPGLRQRSGLARAWFAVNNVMNQTSLGLSFFHGTGSAINAAISDVALAMTRLARGQPAAALLPAVRGASVVGSVGQYLRTGSRMLREWYRPGTTGGDVADLLKAAVMGGARAELASAYRTDALSGFAKALRQVRGEAGAAKLNPLGRALLKLPAAAIEATAWPVMQWMVPRIKFGAFAELARRELERLGPDADRDALRKAFAKAWDSVDNRFGQLVYDNAFWNPVIRDLAMGSVRSVGWNLGDLRELAGGAYDAVAGLAGAAAARRRPELTDRTAFGAALLLVVGAMGAAVMYGLSGRRPRELKDYYYPQTGELDGEGRPVRLSLPTYMKDVFGMARHPLDTLKHKAAPLLSAVADVIENKDYAGTQVREGGAGQQIRQSAEHVAKSALPFSVQQWQKLTAEGVPLAKKLMTAAGFTEAPGSVNDTPAEARAKEIAAAHQQANGRTRAEADKSALRHRLADAIRRDPAAGREQLRKAVQSGQVTPREAADVAAKRSQQSGLAYRVGHMDAADALEVWDLANPEERRELRPLMLKKIVAAGGMTPEAKRAALAKVRGAAPTAASPAAGSS